MGISSDGILVFGYDLGEEEPEFLQEEDENGDLLYEGFDDYIFQKYGDGTHKYAWQFAETFPIAMTMHCSYDYPMYILSLRRTETSASRGSPVKIEGALEVTPDEIALLKDFAKKHFMNFDEEPSWFLCSIMG